MSERLPQNTSLFASWLPILLIGIGTMAFIAIFVLIGWSSDLSSKDRAGDHPYSTSALGYAGLVEMLESVGQEVRISQFESTREAVDGLLILTIPEYGFARRERFDLEMVSEPALYVLPKWTGYRDPKRPAWQVETEPMPRARVRDLAAQFDSDVQVWRVRNPGPLNTRFGTASPDFEHAMQVLESDSLEAVIKTPAGALVSKLPGREVYVLSDPDLLNTFGLARRENARLALGLIEGLKYDPEQRVTLDATLHGFARSQNLLRAIFDQPFLGATLIALATIALIGWSASIRFAPPLSDRPLPSFGKQALAESSAGLISMAGREGQMAGPYRRVVQRSLARDLGLPEHMPEAAFAAAADRLSRRQNIAPNWSQLSDAQAVPAESRNQLRDQALALWRWRQEMKNGH